VREDRKGSQMTDLSIMKNEGRNVVLFYPFVPQESIDEVLDTLHTRWIGQGPKVDRLESIFSERFAPERQAIAVGSGTDAIHLSYLLAGIKKDDEVIVPVFTCTATNIPLLYIGAKPVFADIQRSTMNVDPVHVHSLVTERTKAIVAVHYGGMPCDMDDLTAIAREHQIPIIEDAAQALGASYKGIQIGAISEFTAFSLQAIKQITAGDGGMITVADPNLAEKAKKLRWFGIDRMGKQSGTWKNDIDVVGYKYQMTDIGASLVLGGLVRFDEMLSHRKALFHAYCLGLKRVDGISVVGSLPYLSDREASPWLCTVIVEDRMTDLRAKLRAEGIESNQVHFRNDMYTLFGGKRLENLHVMNELESKYLVLPLHHKVSIEDVERICDLIRKGW